MENQAYFRIFAKYKKYPSYSKNHMTQATNRNTTIDLLKGIAIILVIFAHCIQFGSGLDYFESQSFYNNQIFKSIYSFHMPLFMLISGYLFYFTIQKHSYKYNLKTRFMGLLVPVIIWQTIWILIVDFYNPNNHNVLLLFNSYLNTLWFITSVFINSLIVLICNKYTKDSLLFYIAIFIISLFVPNYHGYNLYVYMLPYFLCGYIYNKTGGIKVSVNWKMEITCFFFLFILFLILLYHYEINDYAYISGTFIMKNYTISISQIYTDIFRWTIGLIGSLCVILLTKLIYNTNAQSLFLKYLRIIGAKTMGLYIVSTYFFKFFYLLPIKYSSYTYILIECIIVTLISYMMTWLIEQNKYSRKFLLGGR